MRSYVRWLLVSHLFKKFLESDQLSVSWATNPSRALYAILRLIAEILPSVVDYECLLQRSAKSCKILYRTSRSYSSVLTIKSMLDELIFWIKLIQNSIGYLLDRCCEYHYLIVFCKVF